jgi:hypothetical protein
VNSNIVRPLISVLLVALSILGLMNVYADNSAEAARAGEVACGAELCDANVQQMQRSVLKQTFVFQTQPKSGRGPTAQVTVECARKFIFAGDYQCVVQ